MAYLPGKHFDSKGGIEIKGADEIKRKLENIAKKFPNVVAAALNQEAEIERTESMRRTPVDFGPLRASHEVETEQKGRDIQSTIRVGGPAAPYAVIVHYDVEMSHKVGQPLFLESTLMQSKPYMAGRVAKRIELNKLV